MKKIFKYIQDHRIYILDTNKLQQKYIKVTPILFAFLMINMFCVMLGFVSSRNIVNTDYMTKEQKVHIINDLDKFSIAEYKQALADLNVKYPRVVYAQALVESNNFKSSIFIENNNSLGMKEAVIRPTINVGTNRGHAIYNSWRDCVIDYALWQSYHIKNIHSEDEYLQLLASIYAEDPNYMLAIKQRLNQFNNAK
jgi:flagellum-specific peptidoglycan hydrolase FlgJ